MDNQPICACKGTEFTCVSVKMPNKDYWNPVICKACGKIMGQMPSNNEQEALKQVMEISTVLERLDNIQTLIYNFEEGTPKNPT